MPIVDKTFSRLSYAAEVLRFYYTQNGDYHEGTGRKYMRPLTATWYPGRVILQRRSGDFYVEWTCDMPHVRHQTTLQAIRKALKEGLSAIKQTHYNNQEWEECVGWWHDRPHRVKVLRGPDGTIKAAVTYDHPSESYVAMTSWTLNNLRSCPLQPYNKVTWQAAQATHRSLTLLSVEVDALHRDVRAAQKDPKRCPSHKQLDATIDVVKKLTKKLQATAKRAP